MAADSLDPLLAFAVNPQQSEGVDPLLAFAVKPQQPPTDADPLLAFATASADPLLQFAHKEEPQANETILGKDITRAETDAIAKKHGVDPEALSELAPLYGAIRAEVAKDGSVLEQVKEAGVYTEGFIGRSILFNLPQWLQKKASTPEYRAAMDELQELVNEKKSWESDVAEIGGAIQGAIKLAKGAAGLIEGAGLTGKASKAATAAYEGLSAVGGGALQGAATAKDGEELKEAGKGAAIGLGLFGLGRGVGKILDARAVRKEAQEALEKAEKATEERVAPEILEQAAKQEEKVLARAEAEADSLLAPVVKRPTAAEAVDEATGEPAVSPLRRALAHQDVPRDAVTLTIEILSPEEIAARARTIELRLAEHNPEALAQLSSMHPNNRALRDATLVSHEIEAELKQTARLASSSVSEKPFEGTTKQALELLQRVSKTEGADYLEGLARKGSVLKRAEELYGEGVFKRLDEFDAGSAEPDMLHKLFDMFRDGRYVARDIDRRLGTNMERTMDQFATATNLYTRHLGALVPEMEQVVQAQHAGGFTDKQVYEALDTGADTILGIAPEAKQAFQEVLDQWRNLFERVRVEASELGVHIAKRENYVPHQTLDPRDLIPRLEGAADQVLSQTGVDLRKGYTDAQFNSVLKDNAAFKGLKDSLGYLTGDNITDGAELRRSLLTALDPALSLEKLKTTAGAAAQRIAEEVPALIREENISKLASKWLTSTFRHAYIREVIDDIRLARNLAADHGEKRAAGYLHRLLQDVVGVPRTGTMADAIRRKTLAGQAALSKIIRESDDPLVRHGAQAILTISDAMPTIRNQMYPNFLGFSVRAALQNITQPFLLTIPELGHGYGAAHAMSALGQIVADITKGRTIIADSPAIARMLTDELGRKVALGESIVTRSPRIMLESQGLLGRQWNTELQVLLENGVQEGAGQVGRDVLHKYNTAAMYMYERAELANRMIVSTMSDGVARDLMAGDSAGAQRFLGTLGESYKRKVTAAIEAGDKKAVQGLVRDYLIGKTVFNYSRASLSEFGRSFGGVFSVFTKWPTSIAGDMIDSFQRQSAGKASLDIFSRYAAPLMSLYIADKMLFGDGPEATNNPFRTAFVGKTGLATWAPVKSISAFADGNLMQPPVIGAVLNGIKVAATADGKEAVKWLNNTATAFVPGAALIRLLGTDLRALQGEQKLEGTLPEVAGQIISDGL